MVKVLLLCFLFGTAVSECPNACSSHGRCGAYDMCTCYRNWMGNDCSQRICQFGMSHIDTPKGDLDASNGYLSGPSVTVAINSNLYPYGTTEQYPNFVDSAGNIIDNSGHEYAECSNKGYCDRDSGVCECFPGYSGSSCSRLSCPINISTGKECSGFGVCLSAREIADKDHHNVYQLWDQDFTMGCVCDAGYSGANCDTRECKVGYDPLYAYDEDNSHRYSNWTYVIASQNEHAMITGNYSIIFYDHMDQQYETNAIDYYANCYDITTALENLPNNAVLAHSVECLQYREYHTLSRAEESIYFAGAVNSSRYYGIKTIIAFPKNPGVLRQPFINIYLDGPRATLFTNESTESTLDIFVYPDGYHGESKDYFTHKCIGVEVSLLKHTTTSVSAVLNGEPGSVYYYLGGLSPLEARILAKCLADGDGNPDTYSAAGRVQGEEYKWDYGDVRNPHIVKLVDITVSPTTRMCNNTMYGYDENDHGGGIDHNHQYENGTCEYTQKRSPGIFVPLFYDESDGRFKLYTRAGLDYSSLTLFNVFTTTSTLQLVSDMAKIFTAQKTPYSTVVYSTNNTAGYNNTETDVVVESDGTISITPRISPTYYGNIDCETNFANMNGAYDCIEKEDRVVIFDPNLNIYAHNNNPKHLNLYTIKRIKRTSQRRVGSDLDPVYGGYNQYTLDMSINTQYLLNDNSTAFMYIFKPDQATSYRYVSPCSNRGYCDGTSGICECYEGYAGDDCATQNNIIS